MTELLELENLAVEMLEAGQSILFGAKGISMQPLIPNGTHLEVQPLKTEIKRRLSLGQVVLCRVPDELDPAGKRTRRLVVHRLVGRLPDGTFLTRGDNCLWPDVPHHPANLLGRVVLAGQSNLNRPVWRLFNGVLGYLSAGQIQARANACRARSRSGRAAWVLARKAASLFYLLWLTTGELGLRAAR